MAVTNKGSFRWAPNCYVLISRNISGTKWQCETALNPTYILRPTSSTKPITELETLWPIHYLTFKSVTAPGPQNVGPPVLLLYGSTLWRSTPALPPAGSTINVQETTDVRQINDYMSRGKLLICTCSLSYNNNVTEQCTYYVIHRDEVPDAEKTGCLRLCVRNIYKCRLEETTNYCDCDAITTA